MASKNQHVVLHDGKWAVRSEGSKRVRAIYDTKQKAIDAARKIVRDQGGTLVIHGRSGQIFQKPEARSSLKEDKIRRAMRGGGVDSERTVSKKKTKKATENSKRAPKDIGDTT